MHTEPVEPTLSAVFVDYDNVYLSLKRKSEDAAKRFAKDAHTWIKAIASGELITPTTSFCGHLDRRLVMNRCYGNPVPRRNTSDSTTDMNSFAFVRHHFLRSGFEIIDCPPLTAQLKNSSDIRMVMDIRDFLDHKINFNEFIILSSDADFTPVLHRLRSHAKRTVIFTNDNTVTPYTALSDGEVREADLIAYLLGDQVGADNRIPLTQSDDLSSLRDSIIDLVTQAVLESNTPVPLEVLAERSTRLLGHEKTVGSNWANAGSFRELLITNLPDTIKLTDEAPYFAFEVARALPSKPLQSASHLSQQLGDQRIKEANLALSAPNTVTASVPSTNTASTPAALYNEVLHNAVSRPDLTSETAVAEDLKIPAPQQQNNSEHIKTDQLTSKQNSELAAQDLQKSISRIHAACAAPPFSPPEYRAIFTLLEQEIFENQLQGVKTLQNISRKASEIGIKISNDDARYILDAVTEGDTWLEQGASVNLLAKRFRNHVVNRCQKNGLKLTSDELELIDAWFVAAPASEVAAVESVKSTQSPGTMPQLQTKAASSVAQAQQSSLKQQKNADWWRNRDDKSLSSNQGAPVSEQQHNIQSSASNQFSQGASLSMSSSQMQEQEDFPRIVRNRLRG